MTKPTVQFFELIFAVFMFLSALVYMLFSTTEAVKSFDELATSQTVYNVQTEIPKEILWTGAQVAGKLYRLTEDAIVYVDGSAFQTAIDVQNNQKIVDLYANYEQKITVNGEGVVEKIEFAKQ